MTKLGVITLASVLAVVAPREATAQGLDLHAVGVGSGPLTTVILHGGPAFGHNYLRPEWDRLAERGAILYYDQRGCGKSTWEGPLGWRQHVKDLDELLEARAPGGQVIVAGSSWGSVLPVLFAYVHPERVAGLILSGFPSWGELVDTKVVRYQALSNAEKGAVSGAIERVSFEVGEYPVRDSSWIAAQSARSLGDILSRRLGFGCPVAADLALRSLFDAPRLAELSRVTVPTLVIDGDLPTVQGTGAADLVEILPDAELRVIPGTGHDPWLDRPDVFFEFAAEFIRVQQTQD